MNMTESTIFRQGERGRQEWMYDAIGRALLEAKKKNAMLSVVVPAKRSARTTPLKHVLLDNQITDLEKGKQILIEGIRV